MASKEIHVNDELLKQWQWRFEKLNEEGHKERRIYELMAAEYDLKPGDTIIRPECVGTEHWRTRVRSPRTGVAHVIALHMRRGIPAYEYLAEWLPYIFVNDEEIITADEMAYRLGEQRPWADKSYVQSRFPKRPPYWADRISTIQFRPYPPKVEREVKFRIEHDELFQRGGEAPFPIEEVSSGNYRLRRR